MAVLVVEAKVQGQVQAEVAEVTQEDMADIITVEVVVHSIVINKVQIP
jgi:hypothetical protein